MKIVLTKEQYKMVKVFKESNVKCGSSCPFHKDKDYCNICPFWILMNLDDENTIDFLMENGVVEE